MTDSRPDSITHAVARLDDELDALLATDLPGTDCDTLLTLAREQERLRNRLAALDQAVVGELDGRGVAFELGCANTAALLRTMLRVTPAEATARVRAANATVTRRTLTGQPVAPRYPAVAAAQAAGLISARHANVITTTIDALPDAIADEHAELLEHAFVTEALDCDPAQLARKARYVIDRLDPDGKFRDSEYRERRRRLILRRNADGSGSIAGECTAELMELLEIVMDSLAAPKPETDGVKDTRMPAQRRHDAMVDALRLLLRTGELPNAGGVPAVLVITLDEDAYSSGQGWATTAHGHSVPAGDAIAWAGGDARVMTVALGAMRDVTAYCHPQRIFTANQRLAMIARDRGCTFPNCEAPPGWCEAHHVTDYARTGRTSIDDGALVCSFDHRERIKQGWATTMIDGRPHWIPPSWFDPQQHPRRNTLFDDLP